MIRLSKLAFALTLVGCTSSPGPAPQSPSDPMVASPHPLPESQPSATDSDAGPYPDVAAFCSFWTNKPNESETKRPCSATWKEEFEIAGPTGPFLSARALSVSEGNTTLMVETNAGLFYLADLHLDASSYGEKMETKVTLQAFEESSKVFLQIDTHTHSSDGQSVLDTRGVIYCNANGSCKTLVHEFDEAGDGYSVHQSFTVTRNGAIVTVAADGEPADSFAETVGTHDLLALP